jgi:hypothetical protein
MNAIGVGVRAAEAEYQAERRAILAPPPPALVPLGGGGYISRRIIAVIKINLRETPTIAEAVAVAVARTGAGATRSARSCWRSNIN